MIRNYFEHYSYKIKHWFFKWELDSEKDLTLTVAKFVHLVKYKEHTIIRFGDNKQYTEAPKYVIEK